MGFALAAVIQLHRDARAADRVVSRARSTASRTRAMRAAAEAHRAVVEAAGALGPADHAAWSAWAGASRRRGQV